MCCCCLEKKTNKVNYNLEKQGFLIFDSMDDVSCYCRCFTNYWSLLVRIRARNVWWVSTSQRKIVERCWSVIGSFDGCRWPTHSTRRPRVTLSGHRASVLPSTSGYVRSTLPQSWWETTNGILRTRLSLSGFLSSPPSHHVRYRTHHRQCLLPRSTLILSTIENKRTSSNTTETHRQHYLSYKT